MSVFCAFSSIPSACKIHCIAYISTVYIILQYAVLNVQPFPRKMKPIIIRIAFIMRLITGWVMNGTDFVTYFVKIMEIPLTPPVVK